MGNQTGPLLYHGSSVQNIRELEPRKKYCHLEVTWL